MVAKSEEFARQERIEIEKTLYVLLSSSFYFHNRHVQDFKVYKKLNRTRVLLLLDATARKIKTLPVQ